MKNKILQGCAYISTGLFFMFASLYIYAEIADLHPNLEASPITCPHISFGKNINVTVMKDWGGNLVFFNQAAPYMGSIVTFTGNKGVKETGIDLCGIYFRWIKNVNRPDSWWTLMISLWYPIIIFGILPAIFVVKKLRSHKSATTEKAIVEKCDP